MQARDPSRLEATDGTTRSAKRLAGSWFSAVMILPSTITSSVVVSGLPIDPEVSIVALFISRCHRSGIWASG